MQDVDPEEIDFRAASELFAEIRPWKAQTPETFWSLAWWVFLVPPYFLCDIMART